MKGGEIPDIIPDWNHLPNELWLKVLGYLDLKALNAIHLVSKKFDCLASKFGHVLKLTSLPDDIEGLASFEESQRFFKAIRGFYFQPEHSVFNQINGKLETAGKLVTSLSLDGSSVDPNQVYQLLRNLPNLEVLKLKYLRPPNNAGLELRESPNLIMPKLKQILFWKGYSNLQLDYFNILIENLVCPAIQELHYENPFWNSVDLMKFVQFHLASLKKLSFHCEGAVIQIWFIFSKALKLNQF